ncbi:MAG TPA: protein kinase [bacterium]|nr:protein kinase [bacterium]
MAEPTHIGRFEIQSELGRGAMGVVYRAVDPHLGRPVALKVLSPGLAADADMVARFNSEARNASHLLHQNIATVFEAGPSDVGWYVAFELVQGQTLRGILAGGQLPLPRATNFLLQIADGLAAAGKAGIVHRDLKPENIMVTHDDVVKITDFGLAKKMGDPGRTRAGTILGTAYYMAPEQARGGDVDGRADWFSLGVIAYEMLTGQRPFDGFHEMAVLYAIVNDDPAPVTSLRADLPEGLVEAVGRMMQKDPASRLTDLPTLRTLIATPAGTSNAAGISAVRSAPAAPELSVLVVLPLENKSPDPEFAFYAEGFAEDIGATLSRSQRFKVLPHDRVLAGRPSSGSSDDWGRALGANYVVSGSLFRAGDQLKIRLYLRDLRSDHQEWSESFSGRTDDIFKFQEEVAQKVASALTGGAAVASVAMVGGTRNAEAYDYYLKGRDYHRRGGQENITFAIDMFNRALEIDPKYAQANAALAESYTQMYVMYYDRDQRWLKKAETVAKTALMIDPNLPEAHRALGRIMMEYGRNEEAIEAFQTAIRQKPDFHDAYRTLAWIYQGMHRYEDSIDWGMKSLRMKPMDRETYLLLGLNYLDLRDWDKARHHFERAIELSPDYGRAYLHLGNVHQKLGFLEEAVRQYRTAMKYLTDVNIYLDLGWALLLRGDHAGARESYNTLITLGKVEFLAFYYLGLLDALDGATERAMARFESTVSMCRKQLSGDPDNPYCVVTLAQALARLGTRDEAVAQESRVGQLEGGNGAITLERARVYAILGEAVRARELLTLALSQPMGPSDFEVSVDPHFAGMQSPAPSSSMTQQ